MGLPASGETTLARGLAPLVAWVSGEFAGVLLNWVSLVRGVLIEVELCLVWHLFAGVRPNIVFRRRTWVGG